MSWQPIETAPIEHVYVLVTDGHMVTQASRSTEGEWWWANTDGPDEPSYDMVITPTHWQPLPPPPE